MCRRALLMAALACTATKLAAQEKSAVQQAQDAFGVSIGDERIGIYTTTDVRGFSPTRANNVRIDGLYFDQVWAPNPRIRDATTIHVGIASLGFAFPAPTGIIDNRLRKPGNRTTSLTAATADSFGTGIIEMDAVLPIVDNQLSVGGGLSLSRNKFNGGNGNRQGVGALTLRWTPSPDLEIQPFWTRSETRDYEMSRTYLPNGAFLPPKAERGRFFGPRWATFDGSLSNVGVLLRYDISKHWTLRSGLFKSEALTARDHFVFLTELTPDGSGRAVVIADPPSAIMSLSGESRLSYRKAVGAFQHSLHLSVRARDRRNDQGAGTRIDLGPSDIALPSNTPEPVTASGARSQQRVRQQTYGLAYEGRRRGVGELNAAIQKSFYRKTTTISAGPAAQSRDDPWLFSIAGALTPRDDLAFYGGYTRGLEESGTAPSNAKNRNEVLPAILTHQRDAGVRWNVTRGINLVAGVFEVQKPYFNLDADNTYVLLGDIRNRGVEVSLAGALSKQLDIVVGGVLSRPRVTGEGVALGRLGARPVDLASRRIDMNLDWRPSRLQGVSFDAALSHAGGIVATHDNTVTIPAQTLIGVGGRYRFRIGAQRLSLRLSVNNLFDVYSWTLRSAGAYLPIDGRRVSLRLSSEL